MNIDLRRKLVWLTAFRTVATTLMLSAIALRQLSTRPLSPLSVEDQASYLVIGAVYLLTLVYALILRRGEARPRHAYLQIVGDVVLATALVFLTGGADSPFTFTYSLAVVYGAILLYGPGAFFAAIASTAAFVVLLSILRLHPPEGALALSSGRLLFTLASNTLAQFLIAALASYLGRLLSTAGGALVAREEDLKKLGALQRQILSAMPSGLMTCSSAGFVTFVNRAGAAILELREEEQGLDMRSVLPGVDWAAVDGLRREVTVPSRSGPKILGLTVSPLEEPGGTALIVFQDLTKLRQMEGELRRADQLAALGRMSAQLAHEIRNPLASMRGSAQMLAEEFPDGRPAKLSRILIRESDRLADLVESFLKFARPPNPSPENLALDALVRETVEMLRADPSSRDVTLELQLEPAPARADPAQLRQVLLNLLRNAFEAVSGVGGRVRISTGRSAQRVTISVWDSAGNISEESLRRIFEPFFTTRAGGTGLGLAVAHSIVQAHGGSFQVSSSSQAGTNFTISLPAFEEVTVANSRSG